MRQSIYSTLAEGSHFLGSRAGWRWRSLVLGPRNCMLYVASGTYTTLRNIFFLNSFSKKCPRRLLSSTLSPLIADGVWEAVETEQ